MSTLLIGLATALGLSSALWEWGKRIFDEPAAGYVLAFPILIVSLARALPREPARRSLGLLWLAAAALVQAAAFASGTPRSSRLAIPLGVIGFSEFTGALGMRSALLAVGLVPLPAVVGKLIPLELAWRALAEALLGPAGSQLRLDFWDSGLRLLLVLAGVGWYANARVKGSWRDGLKRAATLALLSMPIQLMGVTLAVALVRSGRPEWAHALLAHGLWIACLLGAFASVETAPRAQASHAV